MCRLAICLVLVGCAPALDPTEELAGGDTTVFDTTRAAYSYSARNLTAEERGDFAVGNNLFGDNWVTAPSSTSARDGLGPVYNALSCGSCHFNDGRGRPPEPDEGEMVSALVRLSVPGEGPHGGPAPEPTYGGQLQPRSIAGVPAEGATTLGWEELPGRYEDGEPYSLRRPVLTIHDLAFGPLDPETLTSLRVAPPVFGLGLLEAVPEASILALADEGDADGDGISGRPNRVWDARRSETVLGRFGWKANQPTLEQQTAGAFLGDIGITTSLFPEAECGPTQSECAEARDGGSPELSDELLAFVVFYGRTLAVPARRDVDDPEVQRGRALFRSAGCDGCHVPTLETGDSDIEALSHQRIWPYTDLLLHDLGEGLADGRPDFLATGSEWRTPPLWGIGLLETVNRHTYLLHDGRARGLAEAILWHGGEAEPAREAFRSMSAAERAALLRFLESL
jgi:CxxC motif-containing protein (DUF1111 family)